MCVAPSSQHDAADDIALHIDGESLCTYKKCSPSTVCIIDRLSHVNYQCRSRLEEHFHIPFEGCRVSLDVILDMWTTQEVLDTVPCRKGALFPLVFPIVFSITSCSRGDTTHLVRCGWGQGMVGPKTKEH
eukprot:c23728_g1_i4 orf=1651-2040(+)